MPNWLLYVVIASGILAMIAKIPGAIFIGFVLFFLPGVILIAAPNVFVISAVAYLGGTILSGFGRVISWTVPLALLVAIAVALPVYRNAPQLAEIEQLAADDQDWSGFPGKVGTIALLLPPHYSGYSANSSDCAELCQRLLFNKSVQAVLAGAPGTGDAPLDIRQRVTRYSIEQRDTCSPPKIPDTGLSPDEQRQTRLGPVVSDRVKARIAAGECLIAEIAYLTSAEVIVEDKKIRMANHRNRVTARWDLSADTISAGRLSVFIRNSNGAFEEAFRQTYINARPLFVPLFIYVDAHCSSGSCEAPLAWPRRPLKRGEYDPRTFFSTKTGLNVGLPSADGLSADKIRQMLREALGDQTEAPGSARLKLVDQYLKALGGGHLPTDEDIDTVRLIIGHPGATELFHLSNAIRKLGPRAGVLAKPLIDRILTGNLRRDAAQSYANAIVALPEGAAVPIFTELRALAEDERRRFDAASALIRLYDVGATSAPLLMQLVDIGESPKSDRDHERYRNLSIAGMRGLCLLGSDAAEVAPAMLEFLRWSTREANSLGWLQDLTVSALVRTGRRADVEALFADRPDLLKHAVRQADSTARETSARRIC